MDVKASALVIVIVSHRMEALNEFVEALRENDGVEVHQAGEVGALHTIIREKKPQLAVLDFDFAGRDAIAWAKELMSIDAMMTTACLGDMPAEEFHEKSEGLGMLGQYPPHPGKADAQKIVSALMQLHVPAAS